MKILKEGLKCPQCGQNKMRYLDGLLVEGFEVKGYKCSHCGNIEYDADEVMPILAYKKAKKQGFDVIARRQGNSIVLTIPSEIAVLLAIKEGRTFNAKVRENSIEYTPVNA